MTRYRSLMLVLIVALPVASAAGCGDDEQTSPPPTRQEFAAQADAICRSAEQDLRAAQEASEMPPGDEAEFVDEVVIPNFQGQVDEIRELTPPAGEEEKIEAALSAAEQGIGELHPDQRRVPEGLQELHRVLQSYGSGPCVN